MDNDIQALITIRDPDGDRGACLPRRRAKGKGGVQVEAEAKATMRGWRILVDGCIG